MKVIDFTGQIPSAQQFSEFSAAVTEVVRPAGGNLIVIDRGFGFAENAPHLVADHLNFTGTNPLMGPNDPCGERFPVINGIYIEDPPADELRSLPRGILGGLKQGVRPNKAEEEMLRSLGAQFFSYNIVQTMIVAAHAGHHIIGLVIPEGKNMSDELIAAVKSLSDRELAR